MQSIPVRYLLILLSILHKEAFGDDPTLIDARREFDHLALLTSRGSQRAVSLLNHEGQVVRDLSNTITNSGTDLINSRSGAFVIQLETIQNETAAEHINVTSCILSALETITELTELSHLELSTCVNTYTNEGVTIISQGFGHLNTIITTVNVVQRSLEACQADDVQCIAFIYLEIKFQQDDVPRRLQEETNGALTKVERSNYQLEGCSSRAAANLARYGSVIVEQAQTCIDQLINPTPKP